MSLGCSKYNNTEMQFSWVSKFFGGPTDENGAASLPYRPLHKAAQLCCVIKAMLLNLISCCLLTHVMVFSFYIQFAEEPWFTYQATYLLNNILTYLTSTYLPLTWYALFLLNYLPSSLTVCTCSLAHITQPFFVF